MTLIANISLELKRLSWINEINKWLLLFLSFFVDSGTIGSINKVVSHPTLPVLITAHEDRYIRFFDINSGKIFFICSFMFFQKSYLFHLAQIYLLFWHIQTLIERLLLNNIITIRPRNSKIFWCLYYLLPFTFSNTNAF